MRIFEICSVGRGYFVVMRLLNTPVVRAEFLGKKGNSIEPDSIPMSSGRRNEFLAVPNKSAAASWALQYIKQPRSISGHCAASVAFSVSPLAERYRLPVS